MSLRATEIASVFQTVMSIELDSSYGFARRTSRCQSIASTPRAVCESDARLCVSANRPELVKAPTVGVLSCAKRFATVPAVLVLWGHSGQTVAAQWTPWIQRRRHRAGRPEIQPEPPRSWRPV